MIPDDGYAPTPYKKPSARKTPKKGTGPGVCPVTHKKHDKSAIYVSKMSRYPWNDSYFFVAVHNHCRNCGGVTRPFRWITGNSPDEVRKSFEKKFRRPLSSFQTIPDHYRAEGATFIK